MCCYTCAFIREICAIRGQKYNRIFTTDSADESQRLQQRIVCAQKSVQWQSLLCFGLAVIESDTRMLQRFIILLFYDVIEVLLLNFQFIALFLKCKYF